MIPKSRYRLIERAWPFVMYFQTNTVVGVTFNNRAFLGPELRQLLEEQSLKRAELAQIIRTSEREVYRYLKDEQAMPLFAWRLLMLELGLQRPGWGPKKRAERRRRAGCSRHAQS